MLFLTVLQELTFFKIELYKICFISFGISVLCYADFINFYYRYCSALFCFTDAVVLITLSRTFDVQLVEYSLPD
jgi:hypothetical protein